jgi:outer membrane biosynthesis protein TonB
MAVAFQLAKKECGVGATDFLSSIKTGCMLHNLGKAIADGEMIVPKKRVLALELPLPTNRKTGPKQTEVGQCMSRDTTTTTTSPPKSKPKKATPKRKKPTTKKTPPPPKPTTKRVKKTSTSSNSTPTVADVCEDEPFEWVCMDLPECPVANEDHRW